MKPILLVLSLLLILAAGCGKDDDSAMVPLPGTTWQEVENPDILQFAGSNYRVSFAGDSEFRMKFTIWTDAIDLSDSCREQTTFYVKGAYTAVGGTVTFAGQYTDSTYGINMATCRGYISYNSVFGYCFYKGKLILNCDKPMEQRITMDRE